MAKTKKKKARANRVYVAQADTGPVKIGISNNTIKRLRQISEGQPYVLTLVHEERVDPEAAPVLEEIVHIELSHFRRRGEWFNVAPATAVAAIVRAKGNILYRGVERCRPVYTPAVWIPPELWRGIQEYRASFSPPKTLPDAVREIIRLGLGSLKRETHEKVEEIEEEATEALVPTPKRRMCHILVTDFGPDLPVRLAVVWPRGLREAGGEPAPVQTHQEPVRMAQARAVAAEVRKMLVRAHRGGDLYQVAFPEACKALDLAKHRIIQGGVFYTPQEVDEHLAWRRAARD